MPPTMAVTVPADLRAVFDRFYFEWQRNFQVRGQLVESDGARALQPVQLVGGFEVPETSVAILRENFKKVMRYRKIAKQERARRSLT
jgi:hypothetical protein